MTETAANPEISMTETAANPVQKSANPVQKSRRRRCFIVGGVILLLLLLLFIVILVLVLTVFKVREPEVDILSAKLDGIAPRISFPVINVELNVSLDLNLLIHNRNYVSMKHGTGKSILFYKDKEVGEADLYPGRIPARGSGQLACRLTIEADEFASDLSDLIKDIIGGQLVMETRTRIPGRVTIIGIIKKHVIATSRCRFTIAIPAMKIQDRKCKTKAKF